LREVDCAYVRARHQAGDAVDAAIVGRAMTCAAEAATPGDDAHAERGDPRGDHRVPGVVGNRAGNGGLPPHADLEVVQPLAVVDGDHLAAAADAPLSECRIDVAGLG